MLKQRIITSVVLVPCLLALIFWAPAYVLYAILFVVLTVMAYEWRRLIPLQGLTAAAIFIIIYWLCLVAVTYYHPPWFLYLIAIWVPIIIFIVLYPKATAFWSISAVLPMLSILVSCLFAYAMQGIYSLSMGRDLILYLFLLVWAADIGAYMFGKLWGRRKLIPQVSPGKSWEGFLGGSIFVTAIALAGAAYFSPISPVGWFGLIYSCFIVSIFGDLFISMLKRKCKLKDTGCILPGHGGMLDRLDSIISSAPVFYAGLSWLNLGLY